MVLKHARNASDIFESMAGNKKKKMSMSVKWKNGMTLYCVLYCKKRENELCQFVGVVCDQQIWEILFYANTKQRILYFMFVY